MKLQINKMKFNILLFFILGINISFSQESKTIDKIIGKIGGEIILYSDWNDQVSYIKEKQTQLSHEDQCAIFENMFIQKFMIHQARLDSVEVKDEEIDQQLEARIEQILQYMENDTKKFEAYYGQTVNQVRDKFRDDLMNQMLSERLQQKVIGEVTITPDETELFFKRIPKDSLPYFNSEVEISEIVYKPKVNPIEVQKAKDKLSKLLVRLNLGEDFAKLASTYSDDLGSAKNGGNLGWIKRGNLVPEFEAVAFNLEKDSISGIVETEFGYHVIQLLGRRGNNINTRHILIKPQYTDHDYTLAEKYLDSIRTKMLHDTMSFESAVRIFSDKKTESYHNGGQVLNPKTGNSYFEVADLEPDIYFAIDALKVGELSKAIPSKDQEGKTYYRIFKLRSRTDPHKANLKQDYSKIQAAAKENKKNEYFKEWIDRKLPKVYIEIDPIIKSQCPNLSNWGTTNN
ncbi:MAG: peptidylprolyl isomerase [Saprospiraceae bacterium]|nr:peptidylprolyl isomerase [Candidatus Defluviibacterium haderslevense]